MKAKNFTQIMRFILPLIALSLFLESCSQDDVFNETDNINTEIPKGKKVGDLIINEASVILDATSTEQIKSISEDLVVFESEPAQADEIKAGAILVGAKYDGSNLQNIMGKVTDVSSINGEWHVSITPIAIEEFIYSGTISGRIDPVSYPEGSLRNGMVNPNVIIQDVAGFPSYEVLNEEISRTRATVMLPRLEYSGTHNLPIPELPVVEFKSGISLTAGFTPAFDYTIKFGITGIKEFNITLYAKDVLIDANVYAQGGLRYQFDPADYFSIPITPIALGPTGLIISPTVSAGPYVNLELNAGINAKLIHATGEISYVLTNPTQKPKCDIILEPYSWDNNLQWNMRANAEVGLQFSAGLSLTFITTRIASVGAGAKLGIGTTVEMNDLSKVSSDVYGRINADAHLMIGIWPFRFDKTFPIIEWKPTIYANDFYTGI
ncbi:MAG: hypothetical protein E6772_15545 [Dysgonomonas sp.]|nr:hypothetical protein [Dysgonomonas sp.]